MIELRISYQVPSVEMLREGIRAGHRRQVLCAPTGSGKTHCAMHLIEEAIKKGSKTAFICDRLSILSQTSELFDLHQIPHGVIQAGHWRWRPYEYAQICSAQTLARRGIMDDLKLIIVDEANAMYRATIQFILSHPDIVTIGLDAAPFNKALGGVYSNIVNLTTTNQLIKEGWLAPLEVYFAKVIDVKGVKVASTGEWDSKGLELKGREIIGDIVDCWVQKTNEIFGGPVKTIVFSPTVDYGEELCNRWRSEGYNFCQISYKDGNDDSRKELIDEFKKPDSNIQGLISCTALAKGFDCPDILCGVDAHPYRKSLSAVVQQVGRVMRPYPGKSFALWLDHANNIPRFYEDITTFFEQGLRGLGTDHLDSTARKEPEEKQKHEISCHHCGYLLSPSATICPKCGAARKKRASGIAALPGELVKLELGKNGKPVEDFLRDKKSVAAQIWHYALSVKGGNREAARRFGLAQFRNIYDEWPYRRMEELRPEPPDPRLVTRIKAQLIRFHYSQKAKARA